MKGLKDRRAFFIDALAYVDQKGNKKVFASKTFGKITTSLKNLDGWSVDTIFVPDGHKKTLFQMTENERKNIWNFERWRQMTDYLNKIC